LLSVYVRLYAEREELNAHLISLMHPGDMPDNLVALMKAVRPASGRSVCLHQL
jgi:hypothetical protein